jgi:hypothetical protein
MKTENKRTTNRKQVSHLHVHDLTSLSSYSIIASKGHIVDASPTGMLVHVHRKDFKDKQLRSNLNLEPLHGHHVALYIPQMNLDIDGRIVRSKLATNGNFEVAIEFAKDIPLYWRECLIDLLPTPGEFED